MLSHILIYIDFWHHRIFLSLFQSFARNFQIIREKKKFCFRVFNETWFEDSDNCVWQQFLQHLKIQPTKNKTKMLCKWKLWLVADTSLKKKWLCNKKKYEEKAASLHIDSRKHRINSFQMKNHRYSKVNTWSIPKNNLSSFSF